MFELKKIVRKNIWQLKPYSCARDEFSGRENIFLDANENPYGIHNRYPDPQQKNLKKKLSILKNIPQDFIFVGNGSDEIIDLVFKIFCDSQKDEVLIFTPTYGMYQVTAAIHDSKLNKVPLNADFQIDFQKTMPFLKNENLKIIFLCSPNNPTGNSMDSEVIHKILQEFKGIVFLDEAYVDFSEKESFLKEIKNYPNLIICQTLSKAYGLAGIRIGMAYAQSRIIKFFNKVKPPYNVSILNEKKAIKTLSESENFENNKKEILAQKKYLQEHLEKITSIAKIYPSDANFLLIKIKNAEDWYRAFLKKGVVVRNRNSVVKNTLRITVGTPQENKKFIKIFKEIESCK